MHKILLICNAGMSTSLLVSRMEKTAKSKGIEADILAVPVSGAEKLMDDYDIVMLGPQVRHYLKNLQKNTKVPVVVIDMKDYGMMNGENVLNTALKKIEALGK